ncbi:MAG: glycosyltransferase family 4 protein [Candidatus Omnitrophica bacterium]|nr:glycosyltransferase family 4 protein [Candidatus Omnitrophota bacterium]MDD5552962.1 glycosyltransferase family 4 protein [Candidatus Omnitrophota bacterium]
MRILLINKFLYRKGGDAIVTLETGDLLRKKGHDVSFWGMSHPENPESGYGEYFVPFVDLNHEYPLAKKIRISLNMLYSLEAKSRLENVIRRAKPDLVHLHNFAHQISPSILHVLRDRNIPAVMTLHDFKMVCGSYSMLSGNRVCERCKGRNYFHCFLQRCVKGSLAKSLLSTVEMYLHHKFLKIYHSIDAFISPSIFLKNKLREMGFPIPIDYLPNFVNLPDFKPAYEGARNKIAYIGRLSAEKGLLTLLRAVKNLDADLRIIGDGPMRPVLEEQARARKIKNVRFLGYKSFSQMQEEVSKVAAVVIPSECYENNPKSVIESFAWGKPVIASRIGGLPELVIEGKTGFTFRPGDAEDLKGKIMKVLRDAKKRRLLGMEARRLVESKFNPESHYERLMRVYEGAIACHSHET